MENLDAMFIERDKIAEQKNTVNLSKAFKAVVADFITKAGEQAEFDKDIFTRLVDTMHVKNREEIVFRLKDGTEVKIT